MEKDFTFFINWTFTALLFGIKYEKATNNSPSKVYVSIGIVVVGIKWGSIRR